MSLAQKPSSLPFAQPLDFWRAKPATGGGPKTHVFGQPKATEKRPRRRSTPYLELTPGYSSVALDVILMLQLRALAKKTLPLEAKPDAFTLRLIDLHVVEDVALKQPAVVRAAKTIEPIADVG